MNMASPIVCGGGWKGTRLIRLRLKAWLALSGAIVLTDFYLLILAAVSFLLSAVLFVFEKPREIRFPYGRVGRDPHKL